MKTSRLTLMSLLLVPLLALAQAYPSKPVRMIVAYPAGGAADTAARAVSDRLSETLGQPLVIENRGGASGMIAADLVAKAPPDGYTLLLTIGAPHGAYPFFIKKVPFDTIKDFTPIVMISTLPQAIVVHPLLPVASMKELIAYAKQRPGKVFYAIPAIGSSNHMAGLMLNQTAGIEMVPVTYKGGAPALQDLVGGQVSIAVIAVSDTISYVRAGKLRMLAVIQAERAKAAPDTPTVAEAGVPGYSAPVTWVGLFGPARLPAAIVNRVNAAMVKTLGVPAVRARLESIGLEVKVSTPQEFADGLAKSYAIYQKITTDAGIQPE